MIVAAETQLNKIEFASFCLGFVSPPVPLSPPGGTLSNDFGSRLIARPLSLYSHPLSLHKQVQPIGSHHTVSQVVGNEQVTFLGTGEAKEGLVSGHP